MKRQIALLFALTFLVSGMASIAESPAAEMENVEVVEQVNSENPDWFAPFPDGEWMSIPEWNAEMYLPLGWMLSEVTETGFIAVDSEETSSIVVTIGDFVTEEIAEVEETEISESESEEADVIEPSELETFVMSLGQEYEMYPGEEREMAVLSGEEKVTVVFLVRDKLVNMEFVPVEEGSIADGATTIAETFYMYEAAEDEALTSEEIVGEVEVDAE